MRTAPHIHPSFPAVPEALAAECARFLEAQSVRGRSEATIRTESLPTAEARRDADRGVSVHWGRNGKESRVREPAMML